MADNLVELQRSASKIRNPFGFNFLWTWDNQPIVLKGDGRWRSVIKPLRDHLAKHLFNKVYNQYHDEAVLKLKDAGNERAARQFRVPLAVEDKIWYMITGDHLHKGLSMTGANENKNDAADLHELKEEISKMDAQGGDTPQAFSVSSIIDNANSEALSGFNDANVTTKTQRGTAKVVEEKQDKDPVSASLEDQKADEPAKDAEQTAPSKDEPAVTEFPDLEQTA